MTFDHTIEVLQEKNRLFTENVAEWERDSDPHATNKPRAEFARARIAEFEAAIEILNGHKKAQEDAKEESV